MKTIGFKTAYEIACAWQEIETAQKLLNDIDEALKKRAEPDIRDAFGRRVGGLELGVPMGAGGHRLFNVPWTLARPIIEGHIAQQQALIGALSAKARIEIDGVAEGAL